MTSALQEFDLFFSILLSWEEQIHGQGRSVFLGSLQPRPQWQMSPVLCG